MASKTSYVIQVKTRNGWIDVDEQPEMDPALKVFRECMVDEPEGKYQLVERVTTDRVVA